MKKPAKIGMLVNTQKHEALNLAGKLVNWGRKNNIPFLFPPHEAHVLGEPETQDAEWKDAVDVALILGGDGTFLRATRYVLGHDIPLFGINVGHLGFLSCGDPREAFENLQRISEGDYLLEKRSMLHGVVYRGDTKKHEVYALNDLVITKGPFARLISLAISVGNRQLSIMRADGIILATPTGSTAYALSAGGPIVPPHVHCVLVVPICAHTLYSRPMVFSDGDVVTITPEGQHREIMLTQDGQLGYEILPGDSVSVSLDRERQISVITMPEKDYYSLLREKFRWGHQYEDDFGSE
ncbi:MAG: NAD(+)/NADH kinase [Thermovirgaceae bacterium]